MTEKQGEKENEGKRLKEEEVKLDLLARFCRKFLF